nr:MAG TPA: hypothetical protein [Bacteriophage sp.]
MALRGSGGGNHFRTPIIMHKKDEMRIAFISSFLLITTNANHVFAESL